MILVVLILLAAVFVLWHLNSKDELPELSLPVWGCMVLQAGCIAAAIGSVVWAAGIGTTETYKDFIGGFLAMASMGKSYEYRAFYCGLLAFILLIIVLRKCYARWLEIQREDTAVQIALYSLIPAAVMTGQAIFVRNFLWLAFFGAAGVICGLAVLSTPGLYQKAKAENAPQTVLISIFFALVSCFCAGLAGNRLGISLAPVMTVLYAGMLWVAFKREKWQELLVVSQIGIPLGFLHLLSPVMVLRDGGIFDPGWNILPLLIVSVLILAAWYRLLRVLKNPGSQIEHAIPTMVLLALVSLFCALPDAWPGIHADDYHNGEIVLPWFSLIAQGAVPYVDYVPSRGGINYLPGFLLWLFKGHDFSLLNSMMKWADLPLYGIALVMLRRKAGVLAAAAGLLALTGLTPVMGAGVLMAFCCWLWLMDERWEEHPVLFLFWYVLLGCAGTIYSLTDALPMFLALFPLALYSAYDGFRTQRKEFIRFCIVCAAAGVIILLIPVLRNMTLAIVDILLLQSGSYTEAHCVPHMPGMNKTPFTSGVLWDCCRYGFIAMGGLFCAALLFVRGRDKKAFRRFLMLSAFVIIAVIMIQRAGGRVDADNFSRIYLISALMWAVFLPVWYGMLFPAKNGFFVVCAAVWFIGLGVYGKQVECLENLLIKYSGRITEPESTVSPEMDGIPALGKNAALDAGHYKHHLQLRDFMKTVLKPGETIWDLSNNATVYAYHNLPVAMRYPAYFYAAEPKLAQKLADEVAQNLPVLALLEGRNIEFYEGKLPLRAYPLYKLLLNHYRVFKDVNGKVWMIRKGEEQRLDGNTLVEAGSLDDLSIFSDAVADKKIDGYPKTWGASWWTLCDRLKSVTGIQPAGNVSRRGIRLETELLSGDVLLLRFASPVMSRVIRVQWQDEFGGKGRNCMDFWGGSDLFVIPLSTAPNWFLSREKRNLEIIFSDEQPDLPRLLECSLWAR